MNRPPPGEPFIWLTREMVESLAWRLLSKPALRVITRLMIEHMNHGGTENGRLVCTYDQMVAFGVSRKSINGAIALAVRLGFVDIIQRGHRGYGVAKQPSVYALTWLPLMDGTAPTNRWKRCVSPVPKRELKPVPKRELARAPNGNQSTPISQQPLSAQTGTALNISTGLSDVAPPDTPSPALASAPIGSAVASERAGGTVGLHDVARGLIERLKPSLPNLAAADKKSGWPKPFLVDITDSAEGQGLLKAEAKRFKAEAERLTGTASTRRPKRSCVLSVVASARTPLGPQQIVAATGLTRSRVDQLLLKLTRDGEVMRIGRGLYVGRVDLQVAPGGAGSSSG